MTLGATKGEGSCSRAGLVLLEGVLCPFLGGDGGVEGFGIETVAPPRDVGVVDVVGNAEIMKGAQEPTLDAVDQIASVDEVFSAKSEEVPAVGSLRCGGEPEQETWLEVLDELAVASGGGVVELVNNDVVESVGLEPPEVVDAAERLDRSKDHLGLGSLVLSGVETEGSGGTDSPEGVA